jgi:tRNA pseudouridine38-40 synthase
VVTWKLTLEYDGTKYSGWQEQKNARTVQGDLNKAAAAFFGFEIETQGAGRTDAGVHALAQVAHLRAEVKGIPDPGELRSGLNTRLPADICVLDVERVANRFHARHDALTRTYLYQVSSRKTAFAKKYVWWIKEPLDVELMGRAAAKLTGRHDFRSFRAADPARPNESTMVVVESASVELHEHLILFHIEASHFLWRMVRRIVGVLAAVGRGELTPADMERLLGERSPLPATLTAPASGLFLEGVYYPGDAGPGELEASLRIPNP